MASPKNCMYRCLTEHKINFVKYWSIGYFSQILTGQNASFPGRYVASNPESLFGILETNIVKFTCQVLKQFWIN